MIIGNILTLCSTTETIVAVSAFETDSDSLFDVTTSFEIPRAAHEHTVSKSELHWSIAAALTAIIEASSIDLNYKRIKIEAGSVFQTEPCLRSHMFNKQHEVLVAYDKFELAATAIKQNMRRLSEDAEFFEHEFDTKSSMRIDFFRTQVTFAPLLFMQIFGEKALPSFFQLMYACRNDADFIKLQAALELLQTTSKVAKAFQHNQVTSLEIFQSAVQFSTIDDIKQNLRNLAMIMQRDFSRAAKI